MKRFASTRSEKWARQPWEGRAQCSVGSIDEDGIRYGLTTYALITRTIPTAPTMVTTQSIAIRQPRGRLWVSRSIGFLTWPFAPGSARGATRQSARGRQRGA